MHHNEVVVSKLTDRRQRTQSIRGMDLRIENCKDLNKQRIWVVHPERGQTAGTKHKDKNYRCFASWDCTVHMEKLLKKYSYHLVLKVWAQHPELSRNTESQALPQICRTRICILKSSPGDLHAR